MKLFKIVMLLIAAAFISSGTFGQANAFINVLTQNSGQVTLGGNVFIQVDIGNTGPVSDIGVNKVRAQISVPISICSVLPTAQQTGLPPGWIVTANNTGGAAITVCNGSDVIAVGTQRTVLIAVRGDALGGPLTVAGVLSFGPGTGVCTGPGSLPGDNTADNTSTSSIQVIPAPACSLAVTASAGTIACNGSTTTLTATATGANGTVEYSLNGGTFQSGNTFTVNAAGSPYTVTVKEVSNPACTATSAAVTITQPSAISASASAGLIACNGGTTTLTVTATGGSGALQYSLNGGAFQSGNTFTVNAAGSPYTVTVKDANNCTATTAAVTVTQPVALTVTATSTPVTTPGGNNGTATAIPTGGTSPYTYSWNSIPVQTTVTATGLTAGTYIVTVTDSRGCITTATTTVGSPSCNISASASAGLIACNGGTTTLTVTATGGTAPLQYSLNGGAFQSGNIFTVNAAGSPYTVTVRDASNCTAATAAVTVTQPTAITASASAGMIVCNGGTTTLTVIVTGGTAPLQYSLNGGAFQSGNTFTVNAAGSPYTVTVKDASNCTATTATVTVTQPTTLTATATSTPVTIPGGNNGTATAVPAGGTSPYTYSWNSTPVQTTITATGLTAGSYTVTVTDARGCTATATTTVGSPSCNISASASAGVIACNGGTTTLTVTATGGNGTLQYSLNGGAFQSGNTFTINAAGSPYTVTVKDASNCTATTAAVTVTQPTTLTATATSTPVTTPGGNNGTATAVPTGGTSPYTYSWNSTPVQTTITATGLTAGSYTVTVTDAKGCAATATTTVGSPLCNLGVTASAGVIVCSGGTTTLTATATGANGAVEYSLNGGTFQSGNTFTVAPGTYTVTVKDANNCTATTNTLTITVAPDNINPTISAPAGVTVCTNSGCTATGVLLGIPVTADNCTVASVTNNAPASFPLGATTVTWTVTDGSGNTATAAQTVIVNDCTVPTIYVNQSGLQPGVTGPSSSASPYVVPLKPGVKFRSILSVGDNIGGYPMVGIPDGLGAFDNNNGTFTLLMNHEFGNTAGGLHAHGAIGSFVSKWVINKSTLQVQSGSDLMQQVYNWNSTTQSNNTTTSTIAFNRFCSADLPPVSAFYNGATGLGTKARIYMHGEEGGATGYQLGTVANGPDAGKAYILGKFNLNTNGSGINAVGAWENALANPFAQNKTIVIGLNDGGTGIMNNSVSAYVGTKTNTGSEVDKAGLNNGTLAFVNVTGNPTEIVNTATRATNIVSGAQFTLSGTTSTVFSRPEDGTWNPSNPSQFFFLTTDQYDQVKDGIGAQTGRSRLWRLNFTDITNPAAGGTIDLLLDGTEAGNMYDNMTADKFGHLFLQEDVGNQQHNGKIWQYTIATDQLTLLAKHDPARFGDLGQPATAPFNQDEETSGIIDASDILGNGMHLLVDQTHYALASPLVEGGQLLAMFNPESVGATGTAQDTIRVCSGTGVNLGTPATSDNCSVASVTNNAPATFPAGNTTVTWTVTDGSGNTATATQVVIVSTLAVTATSTAVTTTGGNDGTATVTATGGTAPYTYSWNSTPVQTTATATGLTAGSYTVTVTDAAGCTRTATVTVANAGNGKVIPGRIEAESFDAKLGVQFATATTDVGGGQHVAGLTNGSWLDYNVTVLQSGTYTVNFRVATLQNYVQLQIKLGSAILGTVSIANTGGWDTWQTVALNNVALTAGVKTIRIQSASNESCNFNWMDWTLQPLTVPTANAGPAQNITLPISQVTLSGSATANNPGGSIISKVWTKLSGGSTTIITDPNSYTTTVAGLSAGIYVFRLTVIQNDNQTTFSDVTVTVNPVTGFGKLIPGRIEAESFDAKQGPQFAVPTVDAGGGQQVVGITNGSWLDYNVTVTQTGNYKVDFRIATTQNNAQFQVKLGATVLATVNIPNTGGWDTWQTVSVNNIPLTAGAQILRIQSINNASCNFNWMDWALVASSTATPLIVVNELPVTETVSEKKEINPIEMQVSVFPNPTSSYFNLKVQTKSKELVTIRIVDIDGRQVQQLKVAPGNTMMLGNNIVKGTYIIEVIQGSEKVVTKVIKQ